MKQPLLASAVVFALFLVACGGADGSAGDEATSESSRRSESCTFADSTPLVFSSVAQVVTDLGSGTAFAIGDGEFLTAAHVIAGATEISLRTTSDSAPAEIVGAELSTDIALLRSDIDGVAPATFGALDSIAAGHSIGVAGYPEFVADDPAVVSGLVSKIVEDPDLGFGTFVQTDAAVNPGNSGGPMFNECGDVVGMIVIKIAETEIEGISWGVAENTLRSSLPRVRRRGTDDLDAVAALLDAASATATPDLPSQAEMVAATADALTEILAVYLDGDDEYVTVIEGYQAGTLSLSEAAARLYSLEDEFYEAADQVDGPGNSLADVSTICERTRQALVDALNGYGATAGFTGVYLEDDDEGALDDAEELLDFSIERFNEARDYLEGCRAGE